MLIKWTSIWKCILSLLSLLFSNNQLVNSTEQGFIFKLIKNKNNILIEPAGGWHPSCAIC